MASRGDLFPVFKGWKGWVLTSATAGERRLKLGMGKAEAGGEL